MPCCSVYTVKGEQPCIPRRRATILSDVLDMLQRGFVGAGTYCAGVVVYQYS